MQIPKTIGSLLFFDFFAYVPSLSFDKKSSHKTFIGCIISYLFIVMTILVIIDFSDDIILRQSPSLIATEKILSTNDESPRISLGPGGEKLAIGIFRETELIAVDPSYFSLQGRLNTYRPKNDKIFGKFDRISKHFDIVSCSPSQIPLKDGLNYELEGTKLFCFGNLTSTDAESTASGDDMKELIIEGFLGSSSYTSLLVSFHLCKNSTSPVVCKTEEEIAKKINEIFIGGIYMNKYLHPQNYSSPIQESLFWFYTKPDFSINKELQINFQIGKLETDDGLVRPSVSSQEFIYISNTKENVCTQLIGNESAFLKMNFQVDPQQKHYSRKYKRVQDVAAEVGASMKILLLILTVLLKPIVKKSFLYYFADVVLPEKVEEKKRAQNCSRLRILSSFFNPDKRNLREKASEYVINKIDIINLFNKLIEIENLTRVVLEKNQLLLFKGYCYDFRAALKDEAASLNEKGPDKKSRTFSFSLSEKNRQQRETSLQAESIQRALSFISGNKISQSSVIKGNFLEMYKAVLFSANSFKRESPPSELAALECSEKTVPDDMEENGRINNIVLKNRLEIHKLNI